MTTDKAVESKEPCCTGRWPMCCDGKTCFERWAAFQQKKRSRRGFSSPGFEQGAKSEHDTRRSASSRAS